MTLKIAKTIEVQDWMRAPETLAVMAALNTGEEPLALFVGGCVRNALLGEMVEDIDIATKIHPEEVIERLAAKDIKTVPTGIDHGTVTAICGKRSFEITTLRKDVETDGRRAVVAYAESWEEDAQRRDFTMNTLFADSEGNIYDPTGQGLADLEARRVCFVGDPAQRIAEDYLRILRFFRFHAFYGEGDPDPDALAACRAAADQIASLSRERITQEFFKIMTVDDPVDVLSLIFENNVLSEFSFKEYQPDFLKAFCWFQKRYGLISMAPRLLVLAGLKEENVNAYDQYLLIPKVLLKDIEAVSHVLGLPDLDEDHAVRVAVYRYGRVATAQALMIELAQDRIVNSYAPEALEIIQNWVVPDFPLSGEDLMKAGYKEGPELGRKLTQIEDWWISQDFKPDKTLCLKQT